MVAPLCPVYIVLNSPNGSNEMSGTLLPLRRLRIQQRKFLLDYDVVYGKLTRKTFNFSTASSTIKYLTDPY